MSKEHERGDIDPSSNPMGWWWDRMGYEPTREERERLSRMVEELKSVSGRVYNGVTSVGKSLGESSPKFEPRY